MLVDGAEDLPRYGVPPVVVAQLEVAVADNAGGHDHVVRFVAAEGQLP